MRYNRRQNYSNAGDLHFIAARGFLLIDLHFDGQSFAGRAATSIFGTVKKGKDNWLWRCDAVLGALAPWLCHKR